MCGDYQFEIDEDLECEICKNKPAVDLTDPYTGEVDLGYSFLCEKCGIVRLKKVFDTTSMKRFYEEDYTKIYSGI